MANTSDADKVVRAFLARLPEWAHAETVKVIKAVQAEALAAGMAQAEIERHLPQLAAKAISDEMSGGVVRVDLSAPVDDHPDMRGVITPPDTQAERDFSESDWLKQARSALSLRDPLDALRDVEELNAWAHRRWGDVMSHEYLEAFLEKNRG